MRRSSAAQHKPLQLYLAILALNYFYVSNRWTLRLALSRSDGRKGDRSLAGLGVEHGGKSGRMLKSADGSSQPRPAKNRQEHRRRPASDTFIFWPLPNDL